MSTHKHTTHQAADDRLCSRDVLPLNMGPCPLQTDSHHLPPTSPNATPQWQHLSLQRWQIILSTSHLHGLLRCSVKTETKLKYKTVVTIHNYTCSSMKTTLYSAHKKKARKKIVQTLLNYIHDSKLLLSWCRDKHWQRKKIFVTHFPNNSAAYLILLQSYASLRKP